MCFKYLPSCLLGYLECVCVCVCVLGYVDNVKYNNAYNMYLTIQVLEQAIVVKLNL